MTNQVHIRTQGRAGRITLTRPQALNALSYDMCMAIDAALIAWADDDAVELVIIDAEGEKAFCAGGDIAAIYEQGLKGVYTLAADFWRDEYRMNARLAEYAKPVVSFMQGFVMGGGVGVGCHVSHRVVGDSTKMAMPECGIGLIPDVGGTLLLANAPGKLGEFLGLTGDRMGAGDAIYTGFADYYAPETDWPALIEGLCADADLSILPDTPPASRLADWQAEVDALFSGTLDDILTAVAAGTGPAAQHAQKLLAKNSPLAMACTIDLIHRARTQPEDIRHALEQEYRFTSRAMEHGDFLEGIRAAVIDKDRNPIWQHASHHDLPEGKVAAMLAPLPDGATIF